MIMKVITMIGLLNMISCSSAPFLGKKGIDVGYAHNNYGKYYSEVRRVESDLMTYGESDTLDSSVARHFQDLGFPVLKDNYWIDNDTRIVSGWNIKRN